MFRVVVVVAGLASAFPAMAGEMTASEAKHFVVDKLFSYTCFDGTRGMASVHADGSVDGSINSEAPGYHVMAVCPLAPCVLAAPGSAPICPAP